jgi:adenylate cyclase
VAVLIAVLISRSITEPIRILAEETKKIKDFHLDDKIQVASRIKEIQMMINAISAMKTGLQAFRRYVPAELVRQLVHTGEEARPGGHKRELTVFFSDVAGFTTIAERMPPEDLMRHLSEYFDELTRILSDHKGTVDKYIGDGILAFWGAPVPDGDHAFNACTASLLCREKLIELRKKWSREGSDLLFTRIGISTGETIVGNVGSSERINYTVIGDNVNLASRLEGANKFFGTNIIVSQQTYEMVSDKFWFRPLGVIAVKGKFRESTIFELMGKKEEGKTGPTDELCREFSLGLEAYLAREWEAAHRRFRELSVKFPSDTPTEFYLSRCSFHRNNPPGTDWRGIEYLESK